MNMITKSYLAYTRGEKKFSPWCLLRPFGWLGALFVKSRGFFYDHGILESQEGAIAVISVGNLTTGGTNKTPFVEYVASRLVQSGLRPGIVSRGYGGNRGRGAKPIIIVNGNAERRVVSDEPLLLSDHLRDVPIAVSSDRLADVDALRSVDVDVVVADDAFQHRRLARDVDIVLIDAICPFGNGSPLPSGILRELPSSLKRAHAVVISKSDQIPEDKLTALRDKLCKWVPPERLFCSRLAMPEWETWNGTSFSACDKEIKGLKLLNFSGIGNPHSFRNTVEKSGAEVIKEIVFKDHHRYSLADLKAVEAAAAGAGADAICCTEKDVFNLPKGYIPSATLLVPKIKTLLDDEVRFWGIVVDTLRPRLIIASNGYGEDAIGAKLAEKTRAMFPDAEVIAFPLVGQGEPYREKGIKIAAPLTDSPTGGIVKYHLKDLCREIRSGLFSHIGHQLEAWKAVRLNCRTVLCVGDAYLLCHTLWGQGKKALMVATAKTQFISGHWRLETFLYKRRSLKVWTRDEETATALRAGGADAVFGGNPIMDLLSGENADLWGTGRKILVLPGSRSRAYKDLPLLLETLEKIALKIDFSAVLVAALSIDVDKLAGAATGWTFDGNCLRRGGVCVTVYRGDVSDVAQGAELLLGLAGTANQVCAGMGIPVLSIEEKGKFVQKKLLGDSELLVHADPQSLSEAALSLLNDPEKLRLMGEAGKERLGRSGALDSVLDFAATELGWRGRCLLYAGLRDNLYKRMKSL